MRTTILVFSLGSALLAAFAGCTGSTPPAGDPSTTEAAPGATPSAGEASSGDAPVADQEPAAVETHEPAPAPDTPPPGATLDRIMEAHFQDALLIRKAVITGRSQDAADPAYVLANIQDLEGLPPGWRVFVEQMQASARRINNSTTDSAAAAAVADLGVSCGLCHQRHGGPEASSDPMPTASDTFKERMAQHIWATERLWEGLSVPSDTAWNAGVAALGKHAFPEEFLKTGGVDVRAAASDLGRLIAKAPSKKAVADRAALYAELLVTCGTCHQAARNEE